jgi:small-conductance mechanosensitive channel/CRP-like cAMP-binding protein
MPAPSYSLQFFLIQVTGGCLIFLVLFALGRWLKRRKGVKLGVLYVLFCAALAIWLPYVFSGLEMPWQDGANWLDEFIRGGNQRWRRWVVRHLGAATLLLGTFVFLSLVRRFFWEGWFEQKNETKAPKFLSQLVALAVVVAALLVIVGGIYGKSIEGAILGSTVFVGIIGFAMQDLLGNIIAGIALEISKPFKPGDWLVIEQKHAEVVEVNWRSTRLRNNDAVYFDIPNKQIVGGTIINLTFPTREHAIRVTVGFDYNVPPNFVKDCMVRAAAHAAGVLAQPAPKVFLKDFADSAILYEIKFWLEDEARFNDIMDAIKTNVWYEAQRNGIRIPFPIRTVHVEKPKRAAKPSIEAARTSVRKQPFLQLLDDAQTDTLLANARLQRFGRGEHVIEQGEEGRSMFILLHGEASVLVKANGINTQVATLRDGDYFGEMSLLTGEPRSATVAARTDCEMWEIDKEVFAELLQQNETLVEKLSDLLAKRRLENEGHVAHALQSSVIAEKHREYRASFLSKLTAFFEL